MANNPYVNKVELADGTTLIDISNDTVVDNKILYGYTAHNASGAEITGSIQSDAGTTVTPTRQVQTVSVNGKYMTGNITVNEIPNTYYLLTEVYPIGSLYATESSSDNPATILGFGTWIKYAPADLDWNDTDLDWNNTVGVTSGIYVWKRTA